MAPPPVTELDKAVGRFLADWRVECALSQEQFAALMTTALAVYSAQSWGQSMVSKLESGQRGLSMTEVLALASVVGLSVEALAKECS